MPTVPLIRILLQRGQFDLYSSQITSWALCFSIIGLASFGAVKILVNAFYALQDTKTPMVVAVLSLVVNTVLNFVLMFPLKVGGIALASSISGIINFLVLLYLLDKRLGGLDYPLLAFSSKIFLASFLVGIFEYAAWSYLIMPNELLKLILIGGLGFVIYEVVCLWLRIAQAQNILKEIKKWTSR